VDVVSFILRHLSVLVKRKHPFEWSFVIQNKKYHVSGRHMDVPIATYKDLMIKGYRKGVLGIQVTFEFRLRPERVIAPLYSDDDACCN